MTHYSIVSDRAGVVISVTPCQHCGARIKVICVHCLRGTVHGEPLEQFTVSHVQDLDPALEQQLKSWPQFHRDGPDGPYANHCPHCGTAQDDLLLHSEPDQPFFDVPGAIDSGRATIGPLSGTVRLSGDEHFRSD